MAPDRIPAPATAANGSRRRALALLLGVWPALSRLLDAAEANGAPVRLAISESVLGDVNLNDARAAMLIWTRALAENLEVIFDPNLFATTQQIVDRTRRGQLDAMAINVVEYRQISDLLDSSQIVTSTGATGFEQYLILAKQNSGIRQLGDLKGRRLCVLKAPKMCVAPAWLSTILEGGHYGLAEQFFGSVTTDSKFSRVVLPVFFGQADACLTSKRGFDTMCELNPQVGKELKAIASSPAMVVSFYIFRRNFSSTNRARVIRAVSGLGNTVAGRQLQTLFQFDDLGVLDGNCLTNALGILEAVDRARGRRGTGSRREN